MLKIKDNTSKQKLSYINATFWNNQKIKETLINMKSIRNGTIYINDIVVNEYNKNTNQVLPKSNASFIKKENYFDDLVDKVENNPISAMIGINTYDFMNAVDRLNKISDYNDLLNENQGLKKQLEENQNPLKGIFVQVNDDTLLRDCGAMQSEIDDYKSQQQEFISYLEKEIIDCKAGSGQQYYAQEHLRMFKEIIGADK